AYVGCEQGTADWISQFLSQYHGFDPHTTGATAVSWFWGLLTAGCFLGLLLLKIFDSRKVLIGASFGALFCLSAALFGPASVSVIAFPAIGLFASVMWPIVISLALNSVAEHHGSFSGIFITAIIGGAIGFFLGMRHATDPDHVIAVTTIVSQQRSTKRAAVIGALWGLGHTVTIFAVGTAIILFKLVIPVWLGLSMELCVGLMLIALGVWNLVGFVRSIPEQAITTEGEQQLIHSHPHSHGDYIHTHRHSHGPEMHSHSPKP